MGQDNVVQIIIADNGCGLPENINYGKGIKNMRERIAILDGSFEIKSHALNGTNIRITIPMTIQK